MPPIKPTHVITIEIPLVIDPDDPGKPTDADLLARGDDALQELRTKSGSMKYLTGGYQIKVDPVP